MSPFWEHTRGCRKCVQVVHVMPIVWFIACGLFVVVWLTTFSPKVQEAQINNIQPLKRLMIGLNAKVDTLRVVAPFAFMNKLRAHAHRCCNSSQQE
jgi:hypothetical protein